MLPTDYRRTIMSNNSYTRTRLGAQPKIEIGFLNPDVNVSSSYSDTLQLCIAEDDVVLVIEFPNVTSLERFLKTTESRS